MRFSLKLMNLAQKTGNVLDTLSAIIRILTIVLIAIQTIQILKSKNTDSI